MPAIGFQSNFIDGLSAFWTRFFADANQLVEMYKGSAILIGQAYLDLMSATLGIALKDCVVFDKEYYKLITIREDEIRFVEGTTTPDNRWAFVLPDNVVSFASIDNQVIEPTASLEPQRDYEIVSLAVQFKQDPTDPLGTGIPLDGFARRSLDIETGGKFTNTAVADWTSTNVKKGDTLRILDVGSGLQRKREDHVINVVRSTGFYVEDTFPLSVPASALNFVVLRVPASPTIIAESFTLAPLSATLAHTRIDVGSVRVFAKAPGGEDVVEGIDYSLNYEHGTITALTTWQGASPYAIDYTYKKEVYPASGTSPRVSSTGVIVSSSTPVRVLQIATWCPDALVDRFTLSNNFGSFIGRQHNSSEAYRSFLEGIFQLYILGPVLERIESALNVVLNLPVVRDDGEIYQSTDTSDLLVDRILTTRSTGQTAVYEFPKETPLRTDLVAGQALLSFDPLTTAVQVTDYVQTPDWWYGEIIPEKLFSLVNGLVPDGPRRTASSVYIRHVISPSDDARFGDPGLYLGASDEGDASIFVSPHPIFRHRVAFVLMDQYLKRHTFSVKFNATALSAVSGSAFGQSLKDLNDLVLSAKPAHTFAFTNPDTFLNDEIAVSENSISFARLIGSRIFGPDKVIFTDGPMILGAAPWSVSDYFTYELFTTSTALPTVGVPVTLANAPTAPRHGYLVKVYVNGAVGGKALDENLDYSVNYVNRTVTPLTVWDATTVNVTYRQVNIGNPADAPKGAADTSIIINNIDPALLTAVYDPAAAGWNGVVTPATAPRDISLVERAIVVYPH